MGLDTLKRNSTTEAAMSETAAEVATAEPTKIKTTVKSTETSQKSRKPITSVGNGWHALSRLQLFLNHLDNFFVEGLSKKLMVGRQGLEPWTLGLKVPCSAN